MSINADEVQAILGSNWDGVTDLTPYIRAGTKLMDGVFLCMARKGFTMQQDVIDEITRWLSAYAYTVMDPLYKSKSTMGASGSFARDAKFGNEYLGMAIMIDQTGCVKATTQAQTAGAGWLGKTQGESLTFDQRN